MKILSIGNFGVGWDGSICDEEHIASALEELGHEVIRQQRENLAYPPGEYDFILIAQYDQYPTTMTSTLKYNFKCPVIYWAFDYQEDGQDWHERLVGGADLYLSKPLSDAKYPNWRWLSQDFAPEFLDRLPEPTKKDIDVLFTGSWVPWESGKERVKVLKAIDKKFNLQINSVTPGQWIGEGFKNVQDAVMDGELPALINRAKINFSMDHVLAPGYWSDRNAQIMCCGGLVLFRYVPLSEVAFKDRVLYFSSTEGCLNLIENILGRSDDELDKLRNYGYEYAQEHLKVRSRVIDLLTIVESIL